MKKLLVIFIFSALPINLFAQWAQISSPTANTLYSVYFVHPSTGYITGSLDGTVIKTTNGGTSWDLLSTGTTSGFYDMHFTNEQTGFVGGSSKQVLLTTNGGANWEIKTSGSGTIFCMSFYSNIGLTVGNNPSLIDKSTDSGNSWVPVTPPTSASLKGCWLSTINYGWVCGDNGAIWRTVDGGANWTDQSLASTYNFEKVRFFGIVAGYVVGSNGSFLKSTNGGTNWFDIPTGVTGTIYDIFLYNSLTGWIIGDNGTIIRTVDGGANWVAQISPVTNSLRAIYMTSSLTGYIVGSDGLILKTTNGGDPIGIIPNSHPVKYELKQNYPNPFNPITKIEYSILKTANVNLSVYDISGKLVKVLIDEKHTVGSYEIDFDGSGLSSGMYFYKLDTDGFVQTRKMVLVK